VALARRIVRPAVGKAAIRRDQDGQQGNDDDDGNHGLNARSGTRPLSAKAGRARELINSMPSIAPPDARGFVAQYSPPMVRIEFIE
jgi:hypothetical protein